MTAKHAIELAPYDPAWAGAFETERRRLASSLGELAVRIDHHGSTAVPGLAAKPVIDIQISVAVLHPLEPYATRLEQLDYTHLVHPDDRFAPFFFRPSLGPHTHHIHVVQSGGDEERRTLAFRNYLRDHRDVAREYELLKRQLARRFDAESVDAYATAKSAFVTEVSDRALRAGYFIDGR